VRIAELKKSCQGSTLIAREDSIRMRWDMMRTSPLPSQMSESEAQVVKAFDRWSQDSPLDQCIRHRRSAPRRFSRPWMPRGTPSAPVGPDPVLYNRARSPAEVRSWRSLPRQQRPALPWLQ